MKIRATNPSDLDQLSHLFDGYRVFYRKTSDVEAAKKFISERLNNKDSEIYVCEMEDGLLSGFVQLYPLFSSTRMKRLWLLNDLYVNTEFRGEGISLLLIDRAKELVRDSGACGMFLETEKSNMIGNRLYPKAGFELNDGANYYVWDSE
ncbi:MAG: GNAT family N-acetyltransferase [Bacteroidota bacterium]